MTHESRIRRLNNVSLQHKGSYVLYWMQQSQRAVYNHALEFAVLEANRRRLPLLVVFGLTADYPEANWRHFAFMLEGLEDTEQKLRSRGIALKIARGAPPNVSLQASHKAVLLVCDRGYLRHQIQWRREVARKAACPVVEVESDAIIPAALISQKTEYAARTIRPKLHRLLGQYLVPVSARKLKTADPDLAPANQYDDLIKRLDIPREVAPVTKFLKGGHSSAHKKFKAFIQKQLPLYTTHRNRPDQDGSSMMSPYLHFGQISALQMALMVQKSNTPEETKEAFREELIVRRELAINYAGYCRNYDSYDGLPQWARRTLDEHAADRRDPIYSLRKLDAAQTHDAYWNTAMLEMKHTGYMHTYMRMYWGKKILQWRPNPQDAFKIILNMNNKYFLDGRDANSYAGAGWIFGLHDQAWKERPIFGKVRYMAHSGLERKFNMQGYVDKVNKRIADLKKTT